MSANRTVALVGRPNVGKSRLFNRLAGRRIAIVHDQAGVTRDVNSVEVIAQSGQFTLLDTGGIGLEDTNTAKQILDAAEQQVFVAVETASVICFVVDARNGLTTLDEIIAEKLRRGGKNIILVINKVDNSGMENKTAEFSRLGFGPGICVSAEHGYNEDALRDAIDRKLPAATPEEPNDVENKKRVSICFLGRPNVGKSSLCNALVQSERLVVSEVPGTTRDSIELNLDFKDESGKVLPFRLVDTAGMRRKQRVSTPVEYFSAVRSEDSVARSDVVFVVLDAMEGVTKQEQSLLGKALTLAPSVAILVNKWDYAVEAINEGRLPHYKNEREYRIAFEESVRETLFFLPDSPVLFVSAKTGLFVDNILRLASVLDERMDTKLSTPNINRLLQKMFEKRAPARKDGKRFKAYYSVQTGNRPITIRIFCNSVEKMEEGYRRYLERGFISKFGIQGCPVKFVLIGKPPRTPRS